jgi:hypothetical protein
VKGSAYGAAKVPDLEGCSRGFTGLAVPVPRSRLGRDRCLALLRPLMAILGLVQPHIMDLSTSNSAPGEDGSKPCSISQRAATRLRHDHHARITSRSTWVL